MKDNDLCRNFLQNDFNKCGKNAFEYHVIKIVPGDRKARTAVEANYLLEFHDKQKQCYNFAKKLMPKNDLVFLEHPKNLNTYL